MADDDTPTLRADTLAALQAFLAEQQAQKAREEAEAEDTSASLATAEDWELSQFWYDEDTSLQLARELITVSEEIQERTRADRVKIACISCPSIYKALRSLRDRAAVPAFVSIILFEFDPRFHCFGDEFVHYDFNHPLTFPAALKNDVDIIALDPPFLNPDCLGSFTQTVDALRKAPDAPVMLCTGAIMLPHAKRLRNLRPTRQHVGHAKQLQNPFACFVNYEPIRLGGYDLEAEDAHAKAEAEEASATKV